MKRSRIPASRYVLCVRNTGYKVSLETRKIYRLVPDAEAARHGMVRVVDESGGGYLYPRRFFMPIRLPAPVRAKLQKTA